MTKPVSLSKSKQLDRQLIKMMVNEYNLFSLVEDKEFQKFISMLSPGYGLPSRKTVSTSLLPKFYNEVMEEVKLKMTRTDTICLTTDSWTSIRNEIFLSVTVHFFFRFFDVL